MRAVNLIPAELRPKTPGEGDPNVAYAIVGGLALLFVMIVLAIVQSNKATTLNDQAAAVNAEAARHQVAAKPVQQFNDFAGVAESRTLLVGGLAASRFPWGSAIYNLSRSLPQDVTLDTIIATTAGTTAAAASQTSGAAGVSSAQTPTVALTGCTSGWIGYSRLTVWLKNMPGVQDVTSTSSDQSAGITAELDKRTKNCGPSPLTFALEVTYEPRKVNLVGLPEVKAPAVAGPSGGTGASGAAAAPAPAAATTGGAE